MSVGKSLSKGAHEALAIAKGELEPAAVHVPEPDIQKIPDRKLAEDIHLQAEIIQNAYATGDKEKIDQALWRVTDVRRLLKTGILDWFDD
ncbi:MAG: hypothetical protein AAFO17_00590 [Pseudomonadota bacterium]